MSLIPIEKLSFPSSGWRAGSADYVCCSRTRGQAGGAAPGFKVRLVHPVGEAWGGVTLVFKVASGCAERIPRLPSATLPVSGADLRNWLVKVISIRTSMLMLELETYVWRHPGTEKERHRHRLLTRWNCRWCHVHSHIGVCLWFQFTWKREPVRWLPLTDAATRTRSKRDPRPSSAPASPDRWREQRERLRPV